MRNSEFDLIEFFEQTPDLVMIAGEDGFFKELNSAAIEKLGYSKDELFAAPIASFIHPDDKEMTSQWRKRLLNGNPLLNFENRYVAKSGKIIWLEWTSIYFSDKKVVFAIAKDITEKKLLQKEIEDKYVKYKTLATHFKTSMEQDKRYLAAELHEELAQLATVIKFDIDWMQSNGPELSPAWKDKIDHALALAEAIINTIQRIAFSISPKMLDDLGLEATLEWYCREFSILRGIPCRFESNYEESDLSHEVQIDFFRICQEFLTNVLDHTQAGSIRIALEDLGDAILLSIADDGSGFPVGRHEQPAKLANIRERATSINGRLSIEPGEGGGTRLMISIEKQR